MLNGIKTKKIKTILASTVAFVFVSTPVLVDAASFLTPMDALDDLLALANSEQAASDNTDPDAIEDVGSTSSITKKMPTPQVKVTFDKTKFSAGDEVTAHAIATGFTKTDEDLYYTWFLKRKNDDDDDVNQWKINAARIIARGGFDSDNTDYSGSSDGDGFEATFGNTGIDDEDAKCYIQDFESGRIFELQKIKAKFSCPTGYHQQCVVDTPQFQCTYDNVFQGGINIGTVTENKQGCQATTSNDSLDAKIGESTEPSCGFRKDREEDDMDSFRVFAECDSTPLKKAVCVPDGGAAEVLSGSTVIGNVFARNLDQTQMCQAMGVGNLGATCETIGNNLKVDGDSARAANEAVEAKCSFTKETSGSNDGNMCRHLFADPGSGMDTGDGSFGADEERFWGTDPNNKSTAANGKLDEQNVVGMGINSFKWIYQDGDEIGVVVEGESTISTKHNDASRMIMWAFPNNKCDAFKDVKDENKAGFYLERIAGSDTGILAVDFDPDECLKDNLIQPTATSSLQVDLSYYPDSRIVNDPSDSSLSRGTKLTISASVSDNSVALQDIYYRWRIEVSGDGSGNPDGEWIDITNEVLKANPGLILEDINLREIELPLNIPKSVFPNGSGDIQYIRVKAEATELSGSEVNLRGKGVTIIGLTNLLDSIAAFTANVNNDLRLSQGDVICSDSQEDPLCYVTENEIIGVTVAGGDTMPVSWKINGAPYVCTSALSATCSTGSTAYFPAVKNEDGDDLIEVELLGTNKVSGGVVSLKKYFKIIDPQIGIVSADFESAWPKLLGYYKNLDGSKTPDYGTRMYEAAAGKTIKLRALFAPSWQGKYAEFDWMIDGVVDQSLHNREVIELPTEDRTVYNVDISVAFNPGIASQMNNVRRALYTHWQIAPSLTIERKEDSSVQINIIQSGGSLASNGRSLGYMASLAQHASQELIFIIQTLLTGLVIVISMGLIFALVPGIEESRDSY